MTRDELIEKVARSTLYERYFVPDCDSYKDEKEFWENLDEDHMHDAKSEADAAIDTIFAALKEPTEEMIKAATLNTGDPVGLFAISAWQAMLNASPLAPEGGKN